MGRGSVLGFGGQETIMTETFELDSAEAKEAAKQLPGPPMGRWGRQYGMARDGEGLCWRWGGNNKT